MIFILIYIYIFYYIENHFFMKTHLHEFVIYFIYYIEKRDASQENLCHYFGM